MFVVSGEATADVDAFGTGALMEDVASAGGVRLTHRSDELRIVLFGEIDIACVEAIDDQCAEFFEGEKRIAVDLSELTFLDSLGMSMLVRWNERAAGRMVVQRVPAHIRRHLGLIALDRVLSIED